MKPLAPVAPGSSACVRALPFGGLLLRLAHRRWSGTLLVHDEGRDPVVALRLDGGVIMAGRVNGGDGALLGSLVPLCARAEGRVVPAEGKDLLGRGRGVMAGPIDTLRLMAAAVRGPLRDDIVDAAILDIGQDVLKLSPRTKTERYGFTPDECRAIACLDEPTSLVELRRAARLPERLLRRLVYLLLATGGITRMPPSWRVISGALMHAPEVPGPQARSRNDEPTVVAPLALVQSLHTVAEVTEATESGKRTGGRYHLRHPGHDTTQVVRSESQRPIQARSGTLPAPAAPPAIDIDADAHFRAAEMLFTRGNVRGAVFEAQKGMKACPPSPARRALYAWLLYQRSGAGADVPMSVWDHLAEALLADPRCAPAHYIKGVLLAQTGELAEALLHLNKARELDPDDPNADRELRRLQSRASRSS